MNGNVIGLVVIALVFVLMLVLWLARKRGKEPMVFHTKLKPGEAWLGDSYQLNSSRAPISTSNFDHTASVEQEEKQAGSLYPEFCPITREPFFMVIEHPELGQVPTYGGPYDSYTIPVMGGKPGELYHERPLCRYRYDHDLGGWVDGMEEINLRIVDDQHLMKLEDLADTFLQKSQAAEKRVAELESGEAMAAALKKIEALEAETHRWAEADKKATKERDDLWRAIRVLDAERFRAQTAVKRLLVTYRNRLNGDWYEATALDCGLELDAIGFIKEPKQPFVMEPLTFLAGKMMAYADDSVMQRREVWYLRQQLYKLKVAIREVLNGAADKISAEQFDEVVRAGGFLLEGDHKIVMPTEPKRPNQDGFAEYEAELKGQVSDEIIEEVVTTRNGIEVSRQKKCVPRCCFGKATIHQCDREATWAATFRGKRGRIFWCDEHKVDRDGPEDVHGVERIEGHKPLVNSQAPIADSQATNWPAEAKQGGVL